MHWFATTNCLGTVEVDTKKLDLNACINGVSPKHREQVYFIRIGVLTVHSPRKIEMQKDSDGRMMVIPPRLNGLLLRQWSLRKLIEPFLWTYVLEKGLGGDLSIDKDDSVQSLEHKSPSSPPPLTVSVAAKTPVRASSLLNNNDMSMQYPNLSCTLGDDDGYFDPTDPSVDKLMQGLLK